MPLTLIVLLATASPAAAVLLSCAIRRMVLPSTTTVGVALPSTLTAVDRVSVPSPLTKIVPLTSIAVARIRTALVALILPATQIRQVPLLSASGSCPCSRVVTAALAGLTLPLLSSSDCMNCVVGALSDNAPTFSTPFAPTTTPYGSAKYTAPPFFVVPPLR